MNYKKVHDILLKEAYKKTPTLITGTFGDYPAVSPDGYRCYIFTLGECYFDLEALGRRGRHGADFARVVGDTSSYKDAVNSPEVVIDRENKRVLAEIRSAGVSVWVNDDFLKPFDKDARYMVKDARSAVLVYEDDTLVGFVMPVRKN